MAKGGGAKSKKKGSSSAGEKEDWSTKRERDLRHCEAVAGHWLSFSLSKAPWIQISSKPQLRDAFRSSVDMTNLESIDEWTTQVQQALCYYVLLDMIMKDTERVQQFQSLGRGWIFVLLSGSTTQRYSRVKIWFESSDRVLHDHEMDMRAGELVGTTREKYLWGYNPEAEMVFFIKGLAPARPLVCIQRLRPDFRDLDKWAVKPETKIKCLDGKLPSDAEREKVAKTHKRRKRQRDKEKQKERVIRMGERVTIEHTILKLLEIQYGADNALQAAQDLQIPISSDDILSPATFIRTVHTSYGPGILRKIRADGALVLDMPWGSHHSSAAIAHTTHSTLTSSQSSTKAAPETVQSTHQSRKNAVMYIPPPYTSVREIGTWKQYETQRNWDRFESLADPGDLFEQLLAETKAAVREGGR